MADLFRVVHGRARPSSKFPVLPNDLARLLGSEAFRLGQTITTGGLSVADYYVGLGGSNSNNGLTPGSPFATFDYALSVAGAALSGFGKTIAALGGTYNQRITNPPSGTSWTNKLRVTNYQGSTVLLQPSGGQQVLYFGNDVGQPVVSPAFLEFDGINLDGSQLAAGAGSVFLDTRGGGAPNHIRLMNAEITQDNGTSGGGGAVAVMGADNEFLNLSVHGLGGPYGFYLSGDRNLVDGCDIHATASAGVHIYKSGGNPTGNIVRNSLIHGIRESWFFGAADPRLWGILIAGTNNQVYNNVIYDNTIAAFAAVHGLSAVGVGVAVYTGSSGNKVWYNTITGNDAQGINVESSATGAAVQNNLRYTNNNGDGVDSGTGTTFNHNSTNAQNPSFVSASDFHLQGGSAMKGAGVVVALKNPDGSAYASVDKDGNLRANPPSIGAYE